MKLRIGACAVLIAAVSCGGQPRESAAPTAPAASESSQAPPISSAPEASPNAFPLPGATGALTLDFIFFEPKRERVWVPAAGTGSVAVFDVASRTFARVDGFEVREREARGKKRVLGPSAGAIGEGFAYVGNRATREVCAVELQTLKRGACLALPSALDLVEYVAPTHEVWVTTPDAHSIAVLDATHPEKLEPKSIISLPGEPEGYAVDEPHGQFLTNLEDAGSTLAIDLHTHAVLHTWSPGCSSEGPRGIAVDPARNLVFVACTDHVQALDMNGAQLGKLDTGAGVDNIAYAPGTGLLYAAAGKAAKLTVAHVDEHGAFSVVATTPTVSGARNAVSDSKGAAYIADPQNGRLLLVPAPH